MIKITDKRKCCGCSACQNICPKTCIEMKTDRYGFKYPFVDEKLCVDCHLCEISCPVLNSSQPKDKPLSCFLARSTDETVRRTSSSGGLFTELASSVLKNDGVIFGVRFDDRWQPVYDYTESIEGLAAFRGSKYVQTDVSFVYRRVLTFLKSGKSVMFTGTPCYVAGLNHFLGKSYDNLITVDFVCHSIPSSLVWMQYLSEIESATEACIRRVTFRDKSRGWTNYGIRLDLESNSGELITIIESHEDNPYMRGMLHDIFTRPSCSDCPARNYRSGSDLTLADAWGMEKYHQGKNDEKGFSHVLVNTERGKAFLNRIMQTLDYEEIDYHEVEPTSLHLPLTKSCHPSRYREMFYSDLDSGTSVIDAVSHCYEEISRDKQRQLRLRQMWFFKIAKKIFKLLRH